MTQPWQHVSGGGGGGGVFARRLLNTAGAFLFIFTFCELDVSPKIKFETADDALFKIAVAKIVVNILIYIILLLAEFIIVLRIYRQKRQNIDFFRVHTHQIWFPIKNTKN